MSLPNLSFFFAEAGTNLRRSAAVTFITVSTIAIALVMMGAFLLATMNTESFLFQLQSEALVTAYAKPDLSLTDAKDLDMRLRSLNEVENITLVTPEEAANELFSNKDDQELLKMGITPENNPLPYSLRIRLKSGTRLESLLTALKAEKQIDSVSYGEDLFKQLQGMSQLLWISSLAIVLLLGLASMFIVYNTVRLTLYMRREEILIMKLVGATNWFIRGPFVVEGVIQGVIAAVAAILILFSSYHFVLGKLAEILPFFPATLSPIHLCKLASKLLMMGLVLGVCGSLLSLRDIGKFTKSNSFEGV